MRYRTVHAASAALIGVVVCLGGAAAVAETLKASVGVGPKHTAYLGYESFAKYVAEHSDLKVKVFSMSLLSLKETSPGVRDGLADLGFVIPAYAPAEFSETNLASDLSMFATAGRKVKNPGAAMAGAMTEYLFDCPDCEVEYKAQGQVYLGSVASAPYALLCTKPIQTMEDIKGSKIRGGGGNYSRWAEAMGAIAVNLPAQDQYEALSQGVIDCTMTPISDLSNQSLADVTKFVTVDAPGGVFAGTATNNFNIGVWQDLTTEQRAVILRAAARMQAELAVGYHVLAAEDEAAAPGHGVQILKASAEMSALSDAFVQADKAEIEAQFTNNFGVLDTAAKIARVSDLVEKWKTLTVDVGDNPTALEQVYWDEIFAKIDPATYGMN